MRQKKNSLTKMVAICLLAHRSAVRVIDNHILLFLARDSQNDTTIPHDTMTISSLRPSLANYKSSAKSFVEIRSMVVQKIADIYIRRITLITELADYRSFICLNRLIKITEY